jgi:Protein of unknown function (DUF3987)
MTGRLQPKRNDTSWTEAARLWAAIVGSSSIKKTPTLKASTRPLEKLEVEWHKQHKEKAKEYRIAKEEWDALSKEERHAAQEPEAPPPRRRAIVMDATIEAIGEILKGEDDEDCRPRKVLAVQDELSSWFGAMDAYKASKGGADRGHWLRLYNGGLNQIDRVVRGSVYVPNWSACLIGGIQPEPMRKIAETLNADSLLQRFMVIFAQEIEDEADRQPDGRITERYENIIRTLADLLPPRGTYGDILPVRLVEEAHAARERVNVVVKAAMRLPSTSEQMRAALGKWSGLWARICLTFHLIDVSPDRCRRGEGRGHAEG